MKKWTNLYSFLIDHVNDKYIFGENVYEDIDNGNITVNEKKPDSINMTLYTNDILTVGNTKYVI